ncbi:MAG: DUF488 family protein [Anaerolineae bacterium]
MELYTIGYQGRDLAEVLGLLEKNHIEVVLDIRDYPHSRKEGFSKSALSSALSKRGIQYVHLRPLGAPSDMRREYRINHDWEAFAKAFTQRLLTDGTALHGLDVAIALVNSHTSCLLCFEADPNSCHRSIVAHEICRRNGNGLCVTHL